MLDYWLRYSLENQNISLSLTSFLLKKGTKYQRCVQRIVLWDRPHGSYCHSHRSWAGSSNLLRNPTFKTDFTAFNFVFLAILTWPHPQMAIRMSSIISYFLYFFHFTLPYGKMAAAPLAWVPFFVPPCQPRHGGVPLCFSELGSQPCFLFPTTSNPWASPAASNSNIPSNPPTVRSRGQGRPLPSWPQLLLHPSPNWSSCSQPTHPWLSGLSTCCRLPSSLPIV